MLGRDYSSLQEFREVCKTQTTRTELHSGYVLSRVYASDHLRHIAREYCGITNDEIEDTLLASAKGLNQRYSLSELIANNLTVSELGEILGRADHDFHFSHLSYFNLPDRFPSSSLQEFVRNVKAIYADFATFSGDTRSLLRESCYFFNGITRPPGRVVELESVLTCPETDIVSLLYSCSRILVAPNGEQGDYNSYFLARIPVLIRLLFRYGLIEISVPMFAEPVGGERIPERYQAIIFQVRAKLQELLPISLNSINHGRVSLYLEIILHAQDMGWHIAPQSTAEFDLKQQVVPLKSIFDDFQESLTEVCSQRGIRSPLEGRNLYRIFRALKEQSYTYAFELAAPIGSRGGNFRVSALYGPPDSKYDPVYWIPNNKESVAESLREAIMRSRDAHLVNPYDLDALLSSSSD